MSSPNGPSTAAESKLVFVVGSGRCGSSLVQELLCRHPDVGFVSNIDDLLSRYRSAARCGLGRANPWIYHRVPQAFTRKGRVRFAPSEGYRALERQVCRLICEPGRPLTRADATPWLAERVRRFFDRRAMSQGRSVFVHKFTGWSRASLLAEVFPDAKFVHVIRDGRAVANSLVQMPWWSAPQDPALLDQLPADDVSAWESAGRSYPLLAGLEWKAVVESHDDARREIGRERWIDLRYEDFLDAPREELARVLEFCDLKWTVPFDDQVRPYQLTGSRSDAFRKELSPLDVALLERQLEQPLLRYGYLTQPVPTPRLTSRTGPA